MTATNHILTGAALSTVLPLPLAIPIAFASHFMLDALPHFGFKTIEQRTKHNSLFLAVIGLDTLIALLLSVWFVISGQSQQLLVGMVAYSPDLVWVYRFIVTEKFGSIAPKPGGWFVRFHAGIQRYERVWGGFIEIAYAALLLKLF